MSALTLRAVLRRAHRSLLAVGAVLAVLCVLALHHADLGMDHGGHDPMTASVQICLAALTAIGAAVVAIALGLFPLPRRSRPPRRAAFVGVIVTPTSRARARASPALHLRLRVLRC